ncbi:MAG TPA: hypothetical protein VEF34_09450 [Syntrophobacteraceae bacterium]|nr:hypothetical protein [Syntrophobacteraceae bacterium]
MPEINNPFFPELRFQKLQQFANSLVIALRDWGWPTPRRITLYAAPIGYEPGKKFVILFDFPGLDKRDQEHIGNLMDSFTDPRVNSGYGMDNFASVYKNPPGPDFLREWSFTHKDPAGIDRTYGWVIYSMVKVEQARNTATVAHGKLHVISSNLELWGLGNSENLHPRELEKAMPEVIPSESKAEDQNKNPAKRQLNPRQQHLLALCREIKQENPDFKYDQIAQCVRDEHRKRLRGFGYSKSPAKSTIMRLMEGHAISKPGPRRKAK